jgi:hypothetical protein
MWGNYPLMALGVVMASTQKEKYWAVLSMRTINKISVHSTRRGEGKRVVEFLAFL